MALLVPNVGEKEMLERILNGTDDLVLHLYGNTGGDHVPAETDVVTSYDEVNTGGYGQKALTAPWVISGDPTEGSYPQVSFDFTGAATVYGYYVTNGDSSILLWAERFSDGPYNIPSGGGSVKITPKIQLD